MMQGVEAPLHRSMVQPIYLMGVPRNIFWLEVFGGILCGLFFKSFFVVAYWYLYICFLHILVRKIHFFCRCSGTARDIAVITTDKELYN